MKTNLPKPTMTTYQDEEQTAKAWKQERRELLDVIRRQTEEILELKESFAEARSLAKFYYNFIGQLEEKQSKNRN